MEVFVTLTQEIAEAFGYRDRCLGIDFDSQNITLDRFRSRYGRPLKRLQQAYRRGWEEADHYGGVHWEAGLRAARREVVVICPALARRLAIEQNEPPSKSKSGSHG